MCIRDRFNISTLDWEDNILYELDIPRCILPDVYPSAHVFGSTRIEGADIPIAAAAGDQQAAVQDRGTGNEEIVCLLYTLDKVLAVSYTHLSKTFRESISDGAARHDEETVRHYARLAVIDDAIENFSQGYETPVSYTHLSRLFYVAKRARRAPVLCRQQVLRKHGHHPQQGGNPHPEQCPRPAHGDSRRNPHDVPLSLIHIYRQNSTK